MDTSEITAIANSFAEYSRSFTQDELFTFAWADEDRYALLKCVEADSRFIYSWGEKSHEKYFVPRKTLYSWYLNLNIRLARAQKATLSRRRLALLMNSLCVSTPWHTPPDKYVTFGQKYCLISPSLNPDEYVFPLAYILSLMNPHKIGVAAELVHYFQDAEKLESPSEQLVLDSITDALAILTARQKYVLVRRQGLFGNSGQTLQQIGNRLGITRERIRQIESKCWNRIWYFRTSRRFVLPLLLYILYRGGSLVIYPYQLMREVRFLAQCHNIPISRFPGTRAFILGLNEDHFGIPNSMWKLNPNINALASCIQANCDISLAREDLIKLARLFWQASRTKLTKSQKVYLALKQIGKPAHYSVIFKTYDSLFPEDQISEYYVHAILGREEHGVVWIGVKGTFALREWGYEHPSSTLFKNVLEIVQQKFTQTGKAVPYAVITAEIGKHRRIVRPQSIFYATHFNPGLERVYGDYFIPKADNQEEKEISAEELDEILQRFEAQAKGQ